MPRHLVSSVSACSFIGAAVLLLTAFGEGASDLPTPAPYSPINKTSATEATATISTSVTAELTPLVNTMLALTMASDPAAMFAPSTPKLPPLTAPK